MTLQEPEARYVSTQGDTCVICKGRYPFPSNEARGLYPDRKRYPNVFICWECVHWLSKIFFELMRSNSYYLLFVKQEVME